MSGLCQLRDRSMAVIHVSDTPFEDLADDRIDPSNKAITYVFIDAGQLHSRRHASERPVSQRIDISIGARRRLASGTQQLAERDQGEETADESGTRTRR